MNKCMNISIWSITYQHYDEIINQSLNTCIILVRGRSDLFNSGGMVKRGGIFSKFRGCWLKGGVKKFRGVWTLDEAMICHLIAHPSHHQYGGLFSTYLSQLIS